MTDEINDQVTDTEVLQPDREVNVGGELIAVRAFRFAEGLRATPLARPIVSEIAKLTRDGKDGIPSDAILTILGSNQESWIQLIAMSTDKSPAWVQNLSDDDGLALAMAFWEANAGFFMRRLVLEEAGERAKKAAWPRSSTPSSQPGTEQTR